jgi:hypothetical protein
MGNYLPTVHVAGHWCLSPADAGPSLHGISPGLLCRFAELTGNTEFMQLGHLAANDFISGKSNSVPSFFTTHSCGQLLYFGLINLLHLPDRAKAGEPHHPALYRPVRT